MPTPIETRASAALDNPTPTAAAINNGTIFFMFVLLDAEPCTCRIAATICNQCSDKASVAQSAFVANCNARHRLNKAPCADFKTLCHDFVGVKQAAGHEIQAGGRLNVTNEMIDYILLSPRADPAIRESVTLVSPP